MRNVINDTATAILHNHSSAIIDVAYKNIWNTNSILKHSQSTMALKLKHHNHNFSRSLLLSRWRFLFCVQIFTISIKWFLRSVHTKADFFVLRVSHSPSFIRTWVVFVLPRVHILLMMMVFGLCDAVHKSFNCLQFSTCFTRYFFFPFRVRVYWNNSDAMLVAVQPLL